LLRIVKTKLIRLNVRNADRRAQLVVQHPRRRRREFRTPYPRLIRLSHTADGPVQRCGWRAHDPAYQAASEAREAREARDGLHELDGRVWYQTCGNAGGRGGAR